MWDELGKLRDGLGAHLIVIHNGDAHDGDHHDTPDIISRNLETQIRIAEAVFKPLLAVSDEHIIIRGTETHTGKDAWLEENLARTTGAMPAMKSRIKPTAATKVDVAADDEYSHWHLDIEINGVLFNIQHHPESGSMRPWTKGGEVNRIAAMLVYEYAATGERIPDIALRAHKHSFLDSGTNHPTRVFATPAWQANTAFVHRIGAGGSINPPGCWYFICKDGHYTHDRIRFLPVRRKPIRVAL
jgi:hypothetical protein